MSTLFFNVDINNAEGHSLFSVDASVVRLGGSADVELEDVSRVPTSVYMRIIPRAARDASNANSRLGSSFIARTRIDLHMILGDMLLVPSAGCG